MRPQRRQTGRRGGHHTPITFHFRHVMEMELLNLGIIVSNGGEYGGRECRWGQESGRGITKP